MDKERRPSSRGPIGRRPDKGSPGPLSSLLPGDAWCRHQVVIPARTLGSEVCAEPATPVGRLLLDTGAAMAVTLDIPAALYLRMEMLSLRADIEGLEDPRRLDACGRLPELNLWEVEGRHCPEIDRLEIREAIQLDRIAPGSQGETSIARYEFSEEVASSA